MGELVNRGESAIVPEGFYKQVSSILNAARDKAYTAVNFAMQSDLPRILVKVLKQESCAKCVSSILHFQFGTHCVPN